MYTLFSAAHIQDGVTVLSGSPGSPSALNFFALWLRSSGSTVLAIPGAAVQVAGASQLHSSVDETNESAVAVGLGAI